MRSLAELTNDEIVATLADGMLCQPERCRDRKPNACTCALIAERFKEQCSRLSSCEKQFNTAVELLQTMVLAMQQGATTDEILETIRGGVGLLELQK